CQARIQDRSPFEPVKHLSATLALGKAVCVHRRTSNTDQGSMSAFANHTYMALSSGSAFLRVHQSGRGYTTLPALLAHFGISYERLSYYHHTTISEFLSNHRKNVVVST